MKIDPSELNPEALEVLGELAEKSGKKGKDLSNALREAVDAYLERSGKSSESNGSALSKEERKAAFRSVAGAWSEMDVETWLEEIYASRSRSSRPQPEL